jgi:hypothetical protein
VAVFVTGTTSVEALKRFEKAVDLRTRDHRSGVGDRQECQAVSRSGRQLDAASGDLVPDGVVDQVGDESFDEVWVAREGRRFNSGIDLDPETVDHRTAGVKDRGSDDGQVDRLVALHTTLAAGEGEKGFDDGLLLPVRCKQRFAGGSPRF